MLQQLNWKMTGLIICMVTLVVTFMGCSNDSEPLSDPEITGFSFAQSIGLRGGNANTAIGAAAGVFSDPEGGTGDFMYVLVAGDGAADNGKFIIDGNSLKVGGAALAAGNYSIRVEAKDIKNKTLPRIFSITVLEAEGPFPVTPASFKEMITVIPTGNTATVTGSGTDGVFIQGRTVTLDPYSIAKYETTYQLWKEVYDWAVSNDRGANKYTFANPGMEGHGYTGTGTLALTEIMKRPVTTINWVDAVIWCNAYSEKEGLEPVYYQGLTPTVVRLSTIQAGAPGVAMDKTKNGYRLPTDVEWEFAARGGDQTGFAADWAYTYSGSNTVEDVAWYKGNSADMGESNPAFGAHPVGTKTANRLGIYDMAGNVYELCWDFFAAIMPETPVDGIAEPTLFHLSRGGSWNSAALSIDVKHRQQNVPQYLNSVIGFRVVRLPTP